jgi:peptidoglycan/LPS O-acetylase OafA/YrhL
VKIQVNAQVQRPLENNMETSESNSPTISVGPLFERHSKRVLELDGLRGFAALMVFARHAFAGSMIGRNWHGIALVTSSVSKIGVTGVDVFFVLSGYIITTLLISQVAQPDYLRSFYIRRVRRILPPYLLVLLVFAITTRHSEPFVVCSLLFFANGAYLFGSFPLYAVLWSLSVEEHFYLLWPLLLRKGVKRVLIACLSIIVVGEPLLRSSTLPNGAALQLTWFRLDGLSMGAMLALLIPKETLARRRWVNRYGTIAAVLGVLLISSIAIKGSTRGDRWGGSMIFTAVSLVTLACIGYLLAYRGSAKVRWARFVPLVYMGTISYGFYLYHELVFRGFDALMLRMNILWLSGESEKFSGIASRAAICFLLTVGVASISFYAIERPIQQAGRRREKDVQKIEVL